MAATTAQRCVAEFVGTFLLVFTVGCNVLSKTSWAGVSIASVLMVSIYALGGISGANFNPAVSAALCMSQSMQGPGIDAGTFGMYFVVQVIAGVVAAFSYAILFWNSFPLGPAKGFGWLSAGLCEMFYTFMLCFVVLNVAAARKFSDQGRDGNQWYGLAIGFVIIAGGYAAGPISGGCLNPAVAVAIDTSSMGLGFGWCIVYTIFELLGAALSVFFFKLVRPGDFESPPNPDQPASLNSKLVSEFLGTFMLVLTVGLNVLGKSPAGAFSIAASLLCMIYALGDVSGAHFNPAVTVAIFSSGRFKPEDLDIGTVAKYIVTQIAGGIAAAFSYVVLNHGRNFALGPQPGFRWSQVAVAEILFTFVLCFVVLCTAVAVTKPPIIHGLAIGSCVTVGGFAIGSISGGSLNPAVSFGIGSTQLFFGGFFVNAIVYSIFEMIGGVVAGGLVQVTHASLEKKLPS